MYGLGWLGALILGAVLGAAFARRAARVYGLFGLGLLIAFLFVLAVYLSAPPDFQHDSSGCSHCEQYWGRWWEPSFVFFLAGVGYLSYLLGIGVGAGVRALLGARRSSSVG
jgi:uncharacterized membrane protein